MARVFGFENTSAKADQGRLSARLSLNRESLGSYTHFGLARTQRLPAAIDAAVLLSYQLTRWSTS
jgi:hypothetical protein